MTYFKSVLLILVLAPAAKAQDETPLIEKLKQKLNQVHEYDATGKMKTDVALIKAPVGNVKKYYQQPNHFKLVRDGGFSILPKGGISITMNSIFAINNYVALSAGNAMVVGYSTKIVKL
jgi:hypothetical protein